MKAKSPPPSGEGKSVLSGRYELGRVLGQGTFAKVHLARDLISGRHVAIKIIPKDLVLRAGMMEQLTREISAMRIVRHPNIVELHEVMATKTKIYLALELVRGGELFTGVANFGKLTERAARRYFRQLVSAVDFCHSRGVFHRDLKPENLLVDEEGGLKVADFGLSALADVGGVLRTACGTPAYAAPEVSGRKGYDGAKADAWSCGVVLFVLLAGFLPFQDDNIIAMYKKIQRGDFRCPPWFSPEARRVIVRLLDPNPTTRISLAKLVDMPWLKKSPPPLPPMPLPPILSSLPENMNAFELISLSEGLDLSPMFEAAAPEIFEVVRFATREPLLEVVARIEGATIRAGGKFRVAAKAATKAENVGRRLAVVVEVFAVAPMVLVVEVRRDNGDALEYRRFCTDQLRPAIEDIVLARSDGHVAAVC